MGELGAFLKVHRVGFEKRDPKLRVDDYEQYFGLQPAEELRLQGSRCMDCGVPFCHEGCPLGNLIPDWNDLVFRDKWREAADELHSTNNFPEFTGLICPAPCESACVLAINDDPVTIEQIELSIVERAFAEGWIVPEPPARRSGRTVAVIGAGPAGMAAAAELNRCGHTVTVYERDEGPGGLLRFGVPDAKLEKWIIDRRISILEQEGIEFVYDTHVGREVTTAELQERFDALVIAIGSRVPRELEVQGRELAGIHPAMDYLYQRNRWVAKVQGRPFRPYAPASLNIRPMSLSEGLLTASSHLVFSSEALQATAGVDDDAEALKKIARLTPSFLAGTRGAKGTLWLDEQHNLQQTPAFPVHTVDTLGAGDVFHGAFALAITENQDLREALRFASAAAALKCTRFGGAFAAPQRAEVAALLSQNRSASPARTGQ